MVDVIVVLFVYIANLFIVLEACVMYLELDVMVKNLTVCFLRIFL